MTIQTIATPTWTIALPADWTDQNDTDSGMHFASSEGEREFYIATWTMAPGSSRPARALAEEFIAHDLRQLAAMDGHQWQTLDQRIDEHDGYCFAVLDSYDEVAQLRILTCILARDGQAVRAAFHEDGCEDLAQSQAFFAPIVASLRFIPAAPGTTAGPRP